MGKIFQTYEKYRSYVDFIDKYKKAQNAATGSDVDSNANVENKNITTLTGELPKKDMIGTNRLLMIEKLTEMYGESWAEEYIRQLDHHIIYKNDETSIMPYCVSITMYPFLFSGLKSIGGMSSAPTNLQSFNGAFINLVFAVAAQFAGAVSTPEYLTYLDYFIRKEYGDDYYLESDKVVDLSRKQRTIDKVITDGFQQVVHSLNQPAAARNFQSVFWNIAYFDKFYFKGIFDDFVFPDGTEPQWDSVDWLQRRFMNWFNEERTRIGLTFPVETMNLLNNGKTCSDEAYRKFNAEMYAKGHSFFTYTSDSVDSLASCCFDGNQKCLTKSSNGVNFLSFKELYDSSYNDTKRNFTVFHNGSWVGGKIVKLPKRKMFKITTANKKELYVTDNHLFPTINGDKRVDNLTEDDYIMFNCRQLDTYPEQDKKLTYEQGYLIGMYLGDGSICLRENCTPEINLSLNEEKYSKSKDIVDKAINGLSESAEFKLNKPYNNVYPTVIRNKEVHDFIREYVSGRYCYDKELNLDCLLQSYDFRKGILDGYYVTDGGNSNRIYTTSPKLAEQVECLITSLGMNSVIDISDRTDEAVVIRGESFNRNYPLYCIRWYNPMNKRTASNIFKVVNNCEYYKVLSIEPHETEDDCVYCFEMSNPDEPYFTLPNGVISHNCRLRNEIQDNTFSYTLGAGGVATGSKGVITINLNRLVQDAVAEGRDISEVMREQTIKMHHYLTAYNEIVKDNFEANLLPVYSAGYISMDKQFLTIGVNGFVESAEFLGIDISLNDQYIEYGKAILKPIFDENKKARTKELMFNTEFIPAENLGVKNAKWDKEDGYFSPRECYNSYFYKVEDETCNVLDKFKLHGRDLVQYLDGGSALHMNLNEHLDEEQYLHLLDVAVQVGCSYFTYNIPNTVCNKCGHISKKYLGYCEVCGSEDVDWLTRIIGYLKRVSKFSAARIKEAGTRYYGKL